MRRLATVALLVVLLAACGDDAEEPDAALPSTTVLQPSGPTATVRVNGILNGEDDTWVLCPGGMAPCWPVVDDGGLVLDVGRVLAEGTWQRDTITLRSLQPAHHPDWTAPNPCADDDLGRFDDGHPGEPALRDAIRQRSDVAGVWRADDGAVLVVSVTDDPDGVRAALADHDVPGVCVADLGAEHPAAELEAAQLEIGDEMRRWGDQGWVATSSSIDVIANEVVVSFDEIDHRLRSEIEQRWAELVRIDAAVEVVDGTVEILEREIPASEIELATQPRTSAGMGALGAFTLRYDDALDCVWLEPEEGTERVKPIWPFGTRALRDPMVVLDGRGDPIVAVDQRFESGGGFGQVLADRDDRTDCGAESVWVIAPGG